MYQRARRCRRRPARFSVPSERPRAAGANYDTSSVTLALSPVYWRQPVRRREPAPLSRSHALSGRRSFAARPASSRRRRAARAEQGDPPATFTPEKKFFPRKKISARDIACGNFFAKIVPKLHPRFCPKKPFFN